MRRFTLLAVLVLTACGGKIAPEDQPDAGPTCSPGETKATFDCDQCTCTSAGEWSCLPLPGCRPAGKCRTLGATRTVDCNTCTCMLDGNWSCTDRSCTDAGPSTSVDPGASVDAGPTRCPSSWAAATSGRHDDLCAPKGTMTDFCEYPEGSCTCPGFCARVVPADFVPTWQCTAKRTDGCSMREPIPDSLCSLEGKECSYGDCCVTKFTCTGGRWKMGWPECKF